MPRSCTFCNEEIDLIHDGIHVGTVKIETHRNGKKKYMISDGEHFFCNLSCLNTWLCCLAGDELDND